MTKTTTITIDKTDLERFRKLQKRLNHVFNERHQIEKAFTLTHFFGVVLVYMENKVEDLIEHLTIPDPNVEHDPSFKWSKTKSED